jgi:hypothetical protein
MGKRKSKSLPTWCCPFQSSLVRPCKGRCRAHHRPLSALEKHAPTARAGVRAHAVCHARTIHHASTMDSETRSSCQRMNVSMSVSVSWQVFASQEVAAVAKASLEAATEDASFETSLSPPLAAARAADASAHTDPGDFMRATSVDTDVDRRGRGESGFESTRLVGCPLPQAQPTHPQ